MYTFFFFLAKRYTCIILVQVILGDDILGGFGPTFSKRKTAAKNAKLMCLAPRFLGTRILKNAENQRFQTEAGSLLF
jgi:hypothetical protein